MAQASVLDFPLPEMVFGNNFLRFTHKDSGRVIDFSALDGLMSCLVRSAADGCPINSSDKGDDSATPTASPQLEEKGDRTLFKLALAETWANRTDHDVKINLIILAGGEISIGHTLQSIAVPFERLLWAKALTAPAAVWPQHVTTHNSYFECNTSFA